MQGPMDTCFCHNCYGPVAPELQCRLLPCNHVFCLHCVVDCLVVTKHDSAGFPCNCGSIVKQYCTFRPSRKPQSRRSRRLQQEDVPQLVSTTKRCPFDPDVVVVKGLKKGVDDIRSFIRHQHVIWSYLVPGFPDCSPNPPT